MVYHHDKLVHSMEWGDDRARVLRRPITRLYEAQPQTMGLEPGGVDLRPGEARLVPWLRQASKS